MDPSSPSPSKQCWAYISVGSNLGDPLDNCRKGITALCGQKNISLLACSSFYRTQPVDYLDQDWFVNAAIKIQTSLPPFDLLEKMHDVQHAFGRKTDPVRFGPRCLDLDIVFYQDIVMATAHLTIPHPRMHKRRFVLQPICDIDPTVLHPVLGLDVKTILKQLVVEGQEIKQCCSS
jgi:2-amino-4-hydroxy-6-hydroxymethyldihydropteridine diphosphokinase